MKQYKTDLTRGTKKVYKNIDINLKKMRNTLGEMFPFFSDLMSKQLINTDGRSKNGNKSFAFNPDSKTERESQNEMRG